MSSFTKIVSKIALFYTDSIHFFRSHSWESDLFCGLLAISLGG